MALNSTIELYQPDLANYETLYKHFHRNPELSNQEVETALTIVNHLRSISTDLDVRPNIGGHGVAAVFRNGTGPTVLSRADMDALPVEERSGLAYASTKRMVDVHGREQPVMHACGHDMHITCLLAYAELMVSAKETWQGTIVLIFQPAEERGTGAQSMVDDGLYDPHRHNIPIPDVVFSGHVVPARTGVIGFRPGTMASSCDNLRVTFHGRGGHASMPERLIDPIVMASSTILRLQTLVSREISPSEHAVVSCASFQAGTSAENVVSDDATITIDIRANNQHTRQKLLNGVRRIIKAESEASNAAVEPTITPTRSFPVTFNSVEVATRVGKSFHEHFGSSDERYIADYPRLSFSEDFSILASAVQRPSLLFAYGCIAAAQFDLASKEGRLMEDLPSNHSALFAPQILPTVQVGMDAYALSALAWLSKE